MTNENEEKKSNFILYTGSVSLVQGRTSPTAHEAISIDRFRFGTPTFFIDQVLEQLSILLAVDEVSKDQTWAPFPSTVHSFRNIGIQPEFHQFSVCISEADDPTTEEDIPPNFYEVEYTLYWWNKAGQKFYEFSYDVQNQTQVWTLVAQANIN